MQKNAKCRGLNGRLLQVAAVVVSGGATALALPPWRLWWIATLALAVFIAVSWNASTKRAVANGALFGTVGGLAMTMAWLPDGLERLGAGPTSSIMGTAVVAAALRGAPWCIVTGALALSRGLRFESARPFVVAAAVWVVDHARASWWAPAWGVLGHTQAEALGVAQLAVVGGVPLVSALVALTASAAAWLFRSRTRVASYLFAGCIGGYVALILFGLDAGKSLRPSPKPGTTDIRVLLVQPNLHPAERWAEHVQRTNLEVVVRQTRTALIRAGKVDMIVWPENTLVSSSEEKPALYRALRRHVEEFDVPLVTGAVSDGASGRKRFSALWVSPDDGVVDRFDKTRAIPGVEHREGVVGWLFGGLLGLSANRVEVELGTKERPLRGELGEWTILLCYEVLFPGASAQRRTDGTLGILNLANDSWFLQPTPSRQQALIARFRAIEQRLWVVRAVHGGASTILNPFGEAVAELPFGTRGTLTQRIRPEIGVTSAESAGLLALVVVGAASGLALCCLTLRFTRYNRENNR